MVLTPCAERLGRYATRAPLAFIGIPLAVVWLWIGLALGRGYRQRRDEAHAEQDAA